MTTIAFRAGIIAADSLGWTDDIACGTIEKIGRFADGAVWGICGVYYHMDPISRWVACPLGDPPETDEHTTFIVVLTNGVVMFWEKKGWLKPKAPFYAWGSGSHLALGAMMMGATAAQAVQVAADLDAFTGGEIKSLTLGEEPTPIDPLDAFPIIEPATHAPTMRNRLGLE